MQEGIITLLDILGWKGIWQRQKEESPLSSLRKIIEVAKEACSLIEDSYGRDIKDATLRPKFEVVSISDTIAIVSYPVATPDNPGSQFADHGLVASLMLRFSILHGIPLRGAMSVGKFSKDGNVLVGPAVDEVASWYETADWIGVMACPSIYLNRDQFERVEDMFVGLEEYKIPTKGRPTNSLALFWPTDWVMSPNTIEIYKKFISMQELDLTPKTRSDLSQAFLKMGPLTPDIYPKFSNTIDFYDFCMNVE